jgi:DNA-binding CsgD family transcriptional regulator/tetratricopeptide (TPR) repeat protein
MPDLPLEGGLHGREHELALIGEALARLADGTGSVVLIEGSPGMGKSRLIAEVSNHARQRGIAVGNGAADPGGSVVELAALLSTLFDGPSPLLDRRELSGLPSQPEQRFWLLRDLEAMLERAALASPLLICIDDVQWADSGTAAALRTLPRQLAGLPIAWMVAVRPAEQSPAVVDAIDWLKRDGAVTIVLGHLDGESVARLAAELLGAQPEDRVLDLVQQAGGRPFLLVETLLGLAEEERVRIVDGRAELVDDERLPDRVQVAMRDRLARHSKEARDAVTVAASLGRMFSFGELARSLGWPPPALLGPVRELLAADLLTERDDKLAFWHDITREAVRSSIPATARRALDRQAAGILLASGALPMEVAVQLAASAGPGDEVAIVTLLEAARALVTTDPATAAHFGQRALAIASLDDPRRGELVATTAIALHVAGDGDEAIAFADAALRQALPADQEAQVRLSIAGMFAVSAERRITTGRTALALPGLSTTLRARHLASVIYNLVTAGRMDEARGELEDARAVVAAAGDARASFTLLTAESGIEYGEERFGRGLEIAIAARREGVTAGDDQRLWLMHVWRGEHLSVLDRYEEAFAIAADGLEVAYRDRQGWAYQMFEATQGRMLFATGRLSDAAATLEGCLSIEDDHRVQIALEAAGIVALGSLALHLGDARRARRLRDVARAMLEVGTPAVRRHAAWLLALLSMAEGDASAARDHVRLATEPGGRLLLPRLPMDVTDEVSLARIATAAQDDELARAAVTISRRRAELNPGATTIAATASHVRGLVEGSRPDLEQAVELFEQSPRPLALGSALEDLGASLAQTDPALGAEVLGRALAVYVEVGATWDGRRVRSRLRKLGVRRHIVPHDAPTHGWAALTAAELPVARLVAEGLTNQEVADRLFISPHTVNSHLRHIFAKVDVTSRVALTRLVADNDRT